MKRDCSRVWWGYRMKPLPPCTLRADKRAQRTGTGGEQGGLSIYSDQNALRALGASLSPVRKVVGVGAGERRDVSPPVRRPTGGLTSRLRHPTGGLTSRPSPV